MTKEEFLKLDYGNIVTCKRYPGEIYEIDDTDVFGVGDRDPIFRVFGARDRTNKKDIRIVYCLGRIIQIELINQDPRICK